jgi:hypothetical protein
MRDGNPICINDGNSSYQYQHAYTGGGYQDGYNYHDNPGYQQYTNGPAGYQYQGTPYYNNDNGYPGNAYSNGVFVAVAGGTGACGDPTVSPPGCDYYTCEGHGNPVCKN